MKISESITKEDLFEQYITHNKTVCEIANEFSVSSASINRLLKQYEIKKDTKLRSEKISQTKRSKSEEERKAYCEHVSAGRLGKGKGQIPWNKNKHTGNGWLGRTHTEETKNKISATKQNKSAEEKAAIEAKRRSSRKYGQAWNKGIPCPPEVKERIRATLINKTSHEKEKLNTKRINTRRIHGTFATSQPEDLFYARLLQFFSPDDIVRQYYDEIKYPFSCDFYIVPLNLFIELNINWTHGFRPFEEGDSQCAEQLAYWKLKAEKSDYYKSAIYTWTDLDVRKRKIAEKNSLLYAQLYSETDINDFFKLLEE